MQRDDRQPLMTHRAPLDAPRRWQLALLAMTVAAASGGFWILRTFEPTADSWYPKCTFYQATGLHCPGCGATRALRAVLRGDLWMALRCNAMLIVGLPSMLAAVAWQRRRERRGLRSAPQLAWILLACVLAFFALRNLPSPTDSWFAPPTLDRASKTK